ncbi:DUF4097 family beta strand repeat-containing protein [Natrinema sp. 1APR25-10V2]|uniref:DUF4097 family beta strand repeat-containing protein n=1 Tax=Natrinema sp. 1APR25-10V2 TaxID=2951081 RepID=UPI002874410D|nr:DUF4097 family beta strand repeat-containing protein [Natrinema sp. 1APR25-10V2]MDS0474278.1 DUF4097 domain-containing protein [Natrinema sp. 1APR25-10V2]
MRTDVSRRRLLAGGSLGVLGSLAGCLATGRSATETVTETYGTDGVDALSLIAENGSVTVEGNQGEEIEVRGHKAAPTEDALESLTLETGRSDGHLTVETNRDETPFLIGPDAKMDLEATVPAGVRLARAETTNGDVEVSDVTGELVADTTNGRIDVEGVDGALVADSTNGTVHAAGVNGDVRAETTNGSIDVTLAADGGDLTADTTNGEVTVRAPSSLDASVSVSTTNGEVSIEGFDGSNVSSDGDVEVTLGDGTRTIRIETTNGSVTIRSENAS